MTTTQLSFLSSVAVLYSMLAISPGPNFLLITQSAIGGARRQAIATAIGVSTASVLWAALAALGLGAVVQAMPKLQGMLQWAGGAYLVYLGAKMVWGAVRPGSTNGTHGPTPQQHWWRAYGTGLFTNLANPKSLAFFASVFASLMATELPTSTRLWAVLVVGTISLAWNLAVVGVFSVRQVRDTYRRAKRGLDAVVGGALLFFGAKLVLGTR